MAYERWTKEADIKLLQLLKQHKPDQYDNWNLLSKEFPNRTISALKSRATKLKENPPKLPLNLSEWDREDLKLMARLYIQEEASIKTIQNAISVEATLEEVEETLDAYLEGFRKQVQTYAEEHNIALKLPITSTKLKAYFELKDKTGFHKQALKHKLESYG